MKITKKLRSTAYHEAGHAVVANHEGVAVKRVTIEPDGETLGSVIHGKLLNESVTWDTSKKMRWRMEKLVMVCLAGYAAEKKFNPRTRREGSDGDFHAAVNAIGYFVGSNREIELYFELLGLWTKGILDNELVWRQVEVLAEELVNRKTLKGKGVRQVLRQTLDKYLKTRHIQV